MANSRSRYGAEVATVEAARMIGGGHPDGSGGHQVAPEAPRSEGAALRILRERRRVGQEHSIHGNSARGEFHQVTSRSRDWLEKRRSTVITRAGIAVTTRN